MAPEPASKQREGLSLQTLVVAAVASGVAAVVVSHVWKGGTVLAAAMTPVVVSIMKELLRRPMESDIVRRSASKVSGVATAPGRAVVGGTGGRRGSSVTRTTPPPPPMPRAPNGEMLQAGPVRTYGSSGRSRNGSALARLRGRPLKLAIGTGLLAFVVAAVVLTVPELIFGGSVSSGHGTTIFGGASSKSDTKSDTSKPKDQGNQQQTDKSSTQPQDNGTSTSTAPQQTTPSQTQTQPQPQPQQSTPPSSPPPSGGGGGTAPPTPAPTPPSP